MQVDFVMLADYVAVTKENKFVFAGVFDAIVMGEIPGKHPHMALGIQIRVHSGEDTAHRFKVALVDQDGAQVVSPLEGRIQGDEPTADQDRTFKLVLNLGNVEFKSEGRYSFDVFLDGRFEHRMALQVRKSPAAPQ